MKRSTDRIMTTHVGSLPRPNDLMELYRDNAPDNKLLPRLKSAIADIVGQQVDCGVDIVNDGEFGKAMRSRVDYGAWWSYVYDRLAGFELREETAKKGRAAWTFGSKERKDYSEFYAEEGAMGKAGQAGSSSNRMYGLTCAAPVKYTGHAVIKRDVENLKAALGNARIGEAFMTAVSPATLQILPNEYYKSNEDYTWALAEAIREEYKAIVDAGFILQIDDPALVDIYDWWFSLKGDMAGYRKWAAFQVDAVEPRVGRDPGRTRTLPHLLGQLARPSRRRRSTERRGGPAAQGESAGLLGGSRQRATRARMESVEGHQTPRRKASDPRCRQSRHQRS